MGLLFELLESKFLFTMSLNQKGISLEILEAIVRRKPT